MRKVTLLFLTVIIIVSAAAVSRSQTYDVLITSGEIYDGSGGPSYIADVGIKDGHIAAIGQLRPVVARQGSVPSRDRPNADTVIDAQGLAVAPGFINMLSWANESLIEDGRSQSDIRQGVTLEVMGEGWSMGRLEKGYYADIVIFDPLTIIDHATFEKPHQYSTGMLHVFVNGTQVLKDGEHTGAKPGRVVRGPGWNSSRRSPTTQPEN